VTDPLASLSATVKACAAQVAGLELAPAAVSLERPPDPGLGHYSTNAAMVLAGTARQSPRDLAEQICQALDEALGDDLAGAEVAGPGFCNLRMSDRWHRAAVASVLDAGSRFGATRPSGDEVTLIEFVSANPTGPLTAAGARHAAYGDAVARALERSGRRVVREYYVNDTGGQTQRFALSIAARMRGEEPPEDGYQGEYVIGLAEQLAARGIDAGDTEALEREGVAAMMEQITASLDAFGVRFDRFGSERAMHEQGKVDEVLSALRASGHAYESDGALWLRSTEFGDDKDRVLVRAGGEPTYLAGDIAYHLDKLGRAQTLIDVLGADHHGHVPRMRAAFQALGEDPDRLEVVLMQLVHLLERGERAQMAKRKGEFVTLDELVAEIGIDAARFFLLGRSHDSTVELDLDLARSQSSENPVYYVQYAHARIRSVERKAGRAADPAEVGHDIPVEEAESALIRDVIGLPGEVATAADKRAPHRLYAYAMGLAASYHAFYRDCRIVGAPDGLEGPRLCVGEAARIAIAETLDVLGVTAPDSM
jgi:arginyl-tRNA synthetase